MEPLDSNPPFVGISLWVLVHRAALLQVESQWVWDFLGTSPLLRKTEQGILDGHHSVVGTWVGTVVAVCHTVSSLHDLAGMEGNDPSREHQAQGQMVEVGQTGTHTAVVEGSTHLYIWKSSQKQQSANLFFYGRLFLLKYLNSKESKIHSFL